MDRERIIGLRDIVFEYPSGAGRVFDGLCLSVGKRDRIGLSGPNGSGKSTLLHIIMGLVKPASGEVDIFGALRRTEDDFHEVRRRAGFLFQDSDDQLFCPTVDEDIAFGPLNLGLTHEEAHLEVHRTMEELGIESLSGRVTHRLSGGEKRLVALATIAAMRPEALLLDEPTTGLDDEHMELMLNYLKNFSGALLLVSHDRKFLSESVGTTRRVVDGLIRD